MIFGSNQITGAHNLGRRRFRSRGGFTPDKIPGLTVWLMADVGVFQDVAMTIPAVADGSSVQGWQDQSGNSNSPTNAASPPTLQNGAGDLINGLPVVRFDGINDYLVAAFGAALNQPNHIFMSGKQVTWTSNDTIFDAKTGNAARLYQKTLSPRIALYAGLAAQPENNDYTVATAKLIECLFNGAASSIIVNAGAAAIGNPGASAMDGLTLAAFSSGIAAWGNVDIGEFLVYDGAVSGSDLTNLRAYFTTRWGVP